MINQKNETHETTMEKIEEGHMCLLDFGLSAVGGRNWGPGDLWTRAESLEPPRHGGLETYLNLNRISW